MRTYNGCASKGHSVAEPQICSTRSLLFQLRPCLPSSTHFPSVFVSPSPCHFLRTERRSLAFPSEPPAFVACCPELPLSVAACLGAILKCYIFRNCLAHIYCTYTKVSVPDTERMCACTENRVEIYVSIWRYPCDPPTLEPM